MDPSILNAEWKKPAGTEVLNMNADARSTMRFFFWEYVTWVPAFRRGRTDGLGVPKTVSVSIFPVGSRY